MSLHIVAIFYDTKRMLRVCLLSGLINIYWIESKWLWNTTCVNLEIVSVTEWNCRLERILIPCLRHITISRCQRRVFRKFWLTQLSTLFLKHRILLLLHRLWLDERFQSAWPWYMCSSNVTLIKFKIFSFLTSLSTPELIRGLLIIW